MEEKGEGRKRVERNMFNRENSPICPPVQSTHSILTVSPSLIVPANGISGCQRLCSFGCWSAGVVRETSHMVRMGILRSGVVNTVTDGRVCGQVEVNWVNGGVGKWLKRIKKGKRDR